MKEFEHDRLLSQLRPGEKFHFIKDSTEWVVIAMGSSNAIITDGETTTSHSKCVPVKMLKSY
jgi:hypothetical protein